VNLTGWEERLLSDLYMLSGFMALYRFVFNFQL